jgi:catechol 2,3-dioxygenase-like lactoylglutathione lyase family enzyme
MPESLPPLSGLHHLKLPSSNVERSLEWYTRVLGAVVLPEFTHAGPDGKAFAYVVRIPGIDVMIELRLFPTMAAAMRGFDPVVLQVATRADLAQWAARWNGLGIENSSELRGMVGWILVCHDPDGISVRLYTEEEHEFDLAGADTGSPWLAYP